MSSSIGSNLREILETMHGGCIPFAMAATRLNVSERVLMQKMVSNEVIAVDCDNRYMFPQFQFKNGGMLPGLPALLKACKNADPEWILSFLWRKLPGDLSAVDMLLAGVTEIELYALISLAEEEFGTDPGDDV